MLCHLHTNRPPPCSRTLSPKYKNSKLDTTQLAENAALGFIKNTYISNYARYIYMPRTCTMPTSWRFDRHKNRIYGQLFMCSSNNNSNGTEISEKRQKRLMPYTRIHAHQSTEKRQWYNSWCFVQNLHKNPKATERKKKSHNQQSMLVMRHSLYDEMHSRQWQWQSNHFYAYWTSIRILMKTIAKYLFYHRFKIIKSIIIIISQTFSQTDCSMPKYLVM